MTPRSHAALEQRMRAHVARLIADRPRVLVALSGGLDSVTLLHIVRFHTDCAVFAAHFDHAMRPSSRRDADWVRGLCHEWDVPLAVARATETPRSEAAARELRYAFLNGAADGFDAKVIVTAHHADDQAETVLFRLARGTGLSGLAGIRETRGRIVRPLLPFTRRELEAYAHTAGLSWRDDPTNRDLRYARNRIRHRVLPELERARPGAVRAIARLAHSAAEAEDAWLRIVYAAVDDVVTSEDTGSITLARDRLLAYDPAIRARVLRNLSERLGSRLDRTGTAAAMSFVETGASGGVIELTGGVRLAREFDQFVLGHVVPESRADDTTLTIADTGPGAGVFVAGGQAWQVSWMIMDEMEPAVAADGDRHTCRLDPARLRFPLVFRGWRPGDRIRLPYGSKKLKRLFQEQRLGRSRRAAVPVLVDAANDVVWAAGIARSIIALPGADRPILEITVTNADIE